jgi:hypothetical protein
MTDFNAKSYLLSVCPIGDDSALVQGWLGERLVCQFMVKGEIVTLTERPEGGVIAKVKQGDFTYYITQDPVDY